MTDPTWERIVHLERRLEDLQEHLEALKGITLDVMSEVDRLVESQSRASSKLTERIDFSRIASRMAGHAEKMGELASRHKASRGQ